MKVLLRRDLYLAGQRFRVSSNGVEIPDTLDGKEVVLWSADEGKDGKRLVLPRDAKLFDAAEKPSAPMAGELVKETGHPKPIALSQIGKALNPPDAKKVLEKKASIEDDDE